MTNNDLDKTAVADCTRLWTIMTFYRAFKSGARTLSEKGDSRLSQWLDTQAESLKPVIEKQANETTWVLPQTSKSYLEATVRAGFH